MAPNWKPAHTCRECRGEFKGRGKYCSTRCAADASRTRTRAKQDAKRAARGSGPASGTAHPQFRGGAEAHPASWPAQAEQARRRDHHICRWCGTRHQVGPQFPVDHIYPRRFFLDKTIADNLLNLVTLCPTCHGAKLAIETAWLRGDVQAFERYLHNVLDVLQLEALRDFLAVHSVFDAGSLSK